MRTFHLFAVRGFTDQTVRQTLRPAGSGEALRIRLSNRYGTAPLEIEEPALSLYLPGDTGLTTYSAVPYDIGHATPGNRLTADHFDTAEELPTGHFVTGVDVRAPQAPGSPSPSGTPGSRA